MRNFITINRSLRYLQLVTHSHPKFIDLKYLIKNTSCISQSLNNTMRVVFLFRKWEKNSLIYFYNLNEHIPLFTWWHSGLHIILFKESAYLCRRRKNMGLIPGSRSSPGLGNGYPLQYSINSEAMGWQKSHTQLSMHAHMCICTFGIKIFESDLFIPKF